MVPITFAIVFVAICPLISRWLYRDRNPALTRSINVGFCGRKVSTWRVSTISPAPHSNICPVKAPQKSAPKHERIS